MTGFCRILILLTAVFASCLSAQEIESVSFRQEGGASLGEDVLRFNVQSRKHMAYDERVANEDMKRLYNTGFFSDVRTETIKRKDGKIDLIFHVSPKQMVKSISFHGNEKFAADKLQEHVTLAVGAPLSDKRLIESMDKLRDFYRKEGLNDVNVSYFQKKNLEGGIDVIFEIKENLKQKIHSVTFEGLKVFPESELKESIANQKSWLAWVPLLNLGLLDKRALDEDMIRLRDKYWEKGYLDFSVKEVRMTQLPDDPEYVDLVFVLEEGEPYTIGTVQLNGSKRFSPDDLLSMIGLIPGDVFSSVNEKKTVNQIESLYSPLGYVDFIANVRRVPDYRTHKVDLQIDITEGLPYKVRDVFITGNRWTKDHVIRRELAIAPGDAVDKNRISASRDRLLGMGYFQNVDAVSVNSPEPGTKDVDIKVKEKNFLHARLGGGWSDTDGLAGMIELTHSNMDILDPWNYFTGGGQRARVLTLIGVERMDLEVNFTEPWLFGIPLRWDVSGYMRTVAYDDWKEQRIGVTTSLTKRIFDDFTSISGSYTFEHVKVYDMYDKMSYIFQEQEGGSFVGRFQLVLDRDTRDNALTPTSGYNVSLLGSVSSQIFGGTYNYYRIEAKGVNYYSFFDKMFILSTGAKIGYIGGIGGGSRSEIPIYERYFLGGGDSIRGFPYRGVGPTDWNNDVYGGDFMYVISAEISHPIWKFIRGAVFVDVGDSVDTSNFTAPKIGVGYGLRLNLPMVNAPIRLDLAFPVLNTQDGVSNTLRFHFNMGFALF